MIFRLCYNSAPNILHVVVRPIVYIRVVSVGYCMGIRVYGTHTHTQSACDVMGKCLVNACVLVYCMV